VEKLVMLVLQALLAQLGLEVFLDYPVGMVSEAMMQNQDNQALLVLLDLEVYLGCQVYQE